MSVSRRGFLQILEAGRTRQVSGALLAARGLEAHFAEAQAGGRQRPLTAPGVSEIRLSSNENPLGPGKAAIDAIIGKFPEASRYPFNSSPNEGALVEAIASKFKVKAENVVMGAGSQEILKSSMRAFTSSSKSFVTALPTFENCTGYAKRYGVPLTEVKVDSQMRLDVGGMIAAASKPGVGLVFFNNPNNPTATVHGIKTVTDFVTRIRQANPNAVILIDEAYHDYVTDPSYGSALELAMNTPNVFIARTFSKAYGMAGMRIGYAIGQAATVKHLAQLKMPYNVSVFGIAAAIASINDQKHIDDERARNLKVREYTVKALADMGCPSADSQGNFLFTNIKRPAAELRDACAKQGVMIGRDFPPLEKTHARISLGTMEEMQKAVEVFRSVLKPTTTTASRGER